MNHQIATSPTQSQRLLACGVDPKTADMKWTEFIPDEPDLSVGGVIYQWDCDYNPVLDKDGNHVYDGMPAWSTSRLLSLLPDYIEEHLLTIQKTHKHGSKCYFGLGYLRCEYQDKENPDRRRVYSDKKLYGCVSRSLIEAIVMTIEWLTKQGYKLNQIDQ